MRTVLALALADWRVALTYKVRALLNLAGLLLSIVPVYFVAEALQPTMGNVIRDEGGQYFAFVVVGIVAFWFVSESVQGLPHAVLSGIRTGTLEALFATPARVPAVLLGMSAYGMARTLVRSALMLGIAAALGARMAPEGALAALAILCLIVAAHLPFGLLATAGVIAFRTAGPVGRVVVTISTFLGGVYYPTRVVPGWLESVSAALPLTYGLRALRRVLLDGVPPSAVAADVATLLAFVVGLAFVSWLVFRVAFGFARRAGTLAQY
ncbi:MAG: ABC transporter permease [Gemmatimonadota bacterium]